MTRSQTLRSINPATEETIEEVRVWRQAQIEAALHNAQAAGRLWRSWPVEKRCARIKKHASLLRMHRDQLARIITEEMGKLIIEAQEEIDKCALICDYYADNAKSFLAEKPIGADIAKSYICYQPLGSVLAIASSSFPFWQVYRYAIPALAAGNNLLLKHAPNTSICARVIESLMCVSGCPKGVFLSLMITDEQLRYLIEDRRINAVAMAQSSADESAFDIAAKLIVTKPPQNSADSILLMQDANLSEAAKRAFERDLERDPERAPASAATGDHRWYFGHAPTERASSIAAKRFIVLDSVADQFLAYLKPIVKGLHPGNPANPRTTLAPLADATALAHLDAQVEDALRHGALAISGGEPDAGTGYFYKPTLLDRVSPDMRIYRESTAGPLVFIVRANDEAHAIQIANGLHLESISVWTDDIAYGERICRQLDCNHAYVNEMIKRDAILPWQSSDKSGYGFERSRQSIEDFTCAKTIWVS